MIELSFADLANERISTSRGALMNAFAYVIETAGRRQVTDLHVRRLLNYVRAHDRYYSGVPRSLAKLARKLVLSVSTCRTVIRRAVEEFNLLIVIPQRYNRGGQTVNRYTINWDNVDAILYDIELAECAAANDTPVTTDHPPSDLLESSYSLNAYSLQPNSPVRPAIKKSLASLSPCGRGSEGEGVSPHNCKVHPSQMQTESSSCAPDLDIDDLIFHDRLLNCHPRILRVPKHLFPNPWPYTVRRFPRETPKELLAHFDILLAKLRTAMARAKQLNAFKIYARLRTLKCELEAVEFRASNAAMCRTNLPPLNPVPSLQIDPLTAPTQQSLYDLALAVLSDHAPARSTSEQTDIPTRPAHSVALSDHAPQSSCSTLNVLPSTLSATRCRPDQAPQDQFSDSLATYDASPVSRDQAPSSSYSLNAYGLQPSSHDLLAVLDELISDLTAAARCARDCLLTWLKKEFTAFRRSIKTIRVKANALIEVPSHAHDDQAPPAAPNSLHW